MGKTIKSNKKLSSTEAIWEGEISLKSGILGRNRYAKITSSGIKIFKNSSSDSEVIYEIKGSQIVSVVLPRFSMLDALVTGYKGIKVFYSDGDEIKDVHFWARGMLGRILPNDCEMSRLVESVLEVADDADIQRPDAGKKFGVPEYVISLVLVLLGWLFGSFLGSVVMGLTSYLIWWILETEDWAVDVKAVIIHVILVCGLASSVVVSALVYFMGYVL